MTGTSAEAATEHRELFCLTARQTLCCFSEKFSLIPMKVLCTILIVLLGVASPLSLWADAIYPCDQQDQRESNEIFTDESTHADMAGHNGHTSASETNPHHDGSNSGSIKESSAIDCDCCGGCVSACASSACAVSAIPTESLSSVFDNPGQSIPAANRFHSDPDPDSLYRPPNPNA